LAAKASAAAAAAANSARIRRLAARVWDGTANPDGPGLLLRGNEYRLVTPADLDPLVVHALVRLARLAESLTETVRDCPHDSVRRSAAILAARAHPIRVALDD
jgi:hypothetical protein